MIVVAHSPEIGERPDALMWWDELGYHEIVASETYELVLARELVATMVAPNWDEAADWLLDTTTLGSFERYETTRPMELLETLRNGRRTLATPELEVAAAV